MSDSDRSEVRRVYRAIYRDRKATPIERIVEKLRADREWGWAAAEFLDFVERALSHEPPHRRGIVSGRLR